MTKLPRLSVAVLLLAGVLWAGGVAISHPGNSFVVCENSYSHSVRVDSLGCTPGREVKHVWPAGVEVPALCYSPVSRYVKLAPVNGCDAGLKVLEASSGSRALVCADDKSGSLRWPRTGVCWWEHTSIMLRVKTANATLAVGETSAAAETPETTTTSTTSTTVEATTTTVAATTTTVAATTTTTVAATTTTVAATTTVALTCAQGGVCAVGDTGPGGGIVFYYSATAFTSTGSTCNTACHYLEAAPSDQSSGIAWCSNTSTSFGTATGIGSGMANTTNSGCLSGAIYVAAEYTNNSKSDWFLPSKDELNELCKYARTQTAGTGTACASTGTIRTGFTLDFYWSSSEGGDGDAWGRSLRFGYQLNAFKTNAYYVRPVRAF